MRSSKPFVTLCGIAITSPGVEPTEVMRDAGDAVPYLSHMGKFVLMPGCRPLSYLRKSAAVKVDHGRSYYPKEEYPC